jgi:hypothetical protein
MKRTLVCCAFLLALMLPARTSALPRKSMSRTKQLKSLQKMARKRLKLQQKAWKRSFRRRPIPRVERVAAEHQYQIYRRSLRAQQRQELKQLKQQLRLEKTVRRAGQ